MGPMRANGDKWGVQLEGVNDGEGSEEDNGVNGGEGSVGSMGRIWGTMVEKDLWGVNGGEGSGGQWWIWGQEGSGGQWWRRIWEGQWWRRIWGAIVQKGLEG
ncbi:unnamed protein product [Staurois parvus]|uniref:Uncharacterized protein n=1 Tax=Staurois parvus TaxID=386267 RepID=A0ABN9C3E3_9NEOB|nr:unnamed protein product [Staurois parvus]